MVQVARYHTVLATRTLSVSEKARLPVQKKLIVWSPRYPMQFIDLLAFRPTLRFRPDAGPGSRTVRLNISTLDTWTHVFGCFCQNAFGGSSDPQVGKTIKLLKARDVPQYRFWQPFGWILRFGGRL